MSSFGLPTTTSKRGDLQILILESGHSIQQSTDEHPVSRVHCLSPLMYLNWLVFFTHTHTPISGPAAARFAATKHHKAASPAAATTATATATPKNIQHGFQSKSQQSHRVARSAANQNFASNKTAPATGQTTATATTTTTTTTKDQQLRSECCGARPTIRQPNAQSGTCAQGLKFKQLRAAAAAAVRQQRRHRGSAAAAAADL